MRPVSNCVRSAPPTLSLFTLSPLKDELLAELEGMEQEDLEKDLLEVPAGSSKLPEDTIGVDDLPSVRKCLDWGGGGGGGT